MSDLKQFSIIGSLVLTLSACQNTKSVEQLNPAIDAPSVLTTTETTPNLSRLVSEEMVIAAALPVTNDGEDDVVDRPADPLPIVAAEREPSPAEMADLWERIRAGMQLDHHLDDSRVKSELNWYLRHPDYINRVATRASRYLFQIINEIETRQLPAELALLPIVESAFDPFAYSHGRASGLWQFIPSTGKLYGLKIDYWYDGRRDVVAATDAALRYLSSSKKSLNDDWLLALAAYNTGEGNVRHAMRKNRKKNKPQDFFSLKLFRETSAYVPRLLAISELVAHPEKYGIKIKPIANEAYFSIVDIGSQIDLAKAAELAEISIEELYLLNPAFNKWSTHPDGPHRLLVPVAKADNFREKLKVLPSSERVAWLRHKVKSGDSLGSLAQRYQTTVSTLASINKVKRNIIVVGQDLLIPAPQNNAKHYQLSDSQRLKSKQAYAKKKLGVEPQKYQVKSGDSLWLIAKKFKVSTRSLAKWNGMAPTDLLRPGKDLLIFDTKQQTQAMASAPQLNSNPFAANEVIRKVNYRVRNGESLAVIANKFNVSVTKIRKWNQKVSSKKYIQPGDRLTLYVDVTRTK